MANNHWAILTIEQTLTATGYIIVITTDVPCHLYMRYTTKKPGIHHVPVLQRGIYMHSDIRICFVAFEDNEQEEAGDTLIHTFIKEPWPHCETRWFYFHGSIASVASPSTSPIFKKHRYYVAPPTTIRLYSDPHPEITTVDGHTRAEGANLTWADITAHPGMYAVDSSTELPIIIWAWGTEPYWVQLWRTVHLFDASVIPPGATILAATLALYGRSKRNDFPWTPALAVYASNPFSNTSLIGSDYSRVFSTRLSNKISYPDWSTSGMNYFTLNSDGLATIIPGQIVKLSIREANFDAGPLTPSWLKYGYMKMDYYAVEKGTIYRPYLDVTYT